MGFCAIRRASRARRPCPQKRLRKCWRCRAPSHLETPRIGPDGRSPRRRASACARCSVSGRRIASSTFKKSNDPAFAEKVEDVVRLYMSPPCHAVVLSIDEKSQIQALDRTQPVLPLKPGKCAAMTHDYKRNGTTTLFAALNVLDGTVLGRCMKRHRHREFIKFLNAVERKVPAGEVIHVILDNYGTHKHPKVQAWLADHSRWVFHFTPTSASWLNAVENFFSAITRKRIRRGVFKSVAPLEVAIQRYIADHNRHAKPFVWTKTANEILEKLNRLDLHLLNESVH
jgi:transposase